MRSGSLRSRVLISKPDTFKDQETGARSDILTDVAMRRANIQADGGGRQLNIDAQVEIYDVQITLRLDSVTKGIKTGWFITDRFTNNQYRVEYVPPLDSKMRMITVRGNYVSK